MSTDRFDYQNTALANDRRQHGDHPYVLCNMDPPHAGWAHAWVLDYVERYDRPASDAESAQYLADKARLVSIFKTYEQLFPGQVTWTKHCLQTCRKYSALAEAVTIRLLDDDGHVTDVARAAIDAQVEDPSLGFLATS